MQEAIENNFSDTFETIISLNHVKPKFYGDQQLNKLFENVSAIIKFYCDKQENGLKLEKIEILLLDNILEVVNNWFLCIETVKSIENSLKNYT